MQAGGGALLQQFCFSSCSEASQATRCVPRTCLGIRKHDMEIDSMWHDSEIWPCGWRGFGRREWRVP